MVDIKMVELYLGWLKEYYNNIWDNIASDENADSLHTELDEVEGWLINLMRMEKNLMYYNDGFAAKKEE
jgi:hypothetical protein